MGLFSASSEAGSLAVAVYPKFWQDKPVERQVVWPSDSGHLAIAVGELDHVELEAEPARLALLDQPVKRRGQSAQALIAPAPPAPLDGPDPVTPSLDPLTALVGLESLMRRVGASALLTVDAGTDAPHLKDPFLRPLLYRHFVDEVEQVIRQARRDYRWVEEVLPVVRGRPHPSSLAVHASTGWPQISCRFQDFTRASPTLTSICSALDHVAEDGVLSEASFNAVGPVRNDAIRLRRMLADVPSTSRVTAVQTARQICRAGRHDMWRHALGLALGVLWPDAGLDLGESDQAVEFAFDSSRIWELIVLNIFRSADLAAFDLKSAEDLPLNASRPWAGLGEAHLQPDLLVRDEYSWQVVDAKYKALSGVPAIEDLYQIFAYSHLASLEADGTVDHLGLVYPTRDKRETTVTGPHARLPDKSVALMIYRFLFPTIADCRHGWNRYLSDQGRRVPASLAQAPAA